MSPLKAFIVWVIVGVVTAGCGGSGSSSTGGGTSTPAVIAKQINDCLTAHGATTVKLTDGGRGGLATFAGDTPAWNADGGYASWSFATSDDANGDPIAVVGFTSQHVGTAAGAAMKACAYKVG